MTLIYIYQSKSLVATDFIFGNHDNKIDPRIKKCVSDGNVCQDFFPKTSMKKAKERKNVILKFNLCSGSSSVLIMLILVFTMQT